MRKQNNKIKGEKFEKKAIKSIGSGRFATNPLDASTEDYSIEFKYTDKKGFRISLKLLEKIWNQALDVNKEPLLQIGIRRNEDEIFIINCEIELKRENTIGNRGRHHIPI